MLIFLYLLTKLYYCIITHPLGSIGITKPVIGGDVGIRKRFDWLFFWLIVFAQIGFVSVASAETLRAKAEVLGEHYLLRIFQAVIGFIQLVI